MKKRCNILGELWNEEEGFYQEDFVRSEYASGKCDLTYSVEQQKRITSWT